VLDAVALERKGIHTVTIVWDTFEKAARTAARARGFPQLELVVIPFRKGDDTAETQRAKARDALPRIAAKLLRQPPA
jgi:hypothetical protein